MIKQASAGFGRNRVIFLAIAIGISTLSLPVFAISVTGTTSDNGYPAHLVKWTDASGLPRSAMMVDERATAPYTGYLRQYTYQINGVTRVCTGSYNYATDKHLEFSGDGFVQNHTAGGGDVSTGNGSGTFPGATAITLQGSSHVIITYNIPTYRIGGVTVPTTIQWFFADGRSNPIFAITQDASASPGNLGADSRSPYGDMAYDGATTGDPIAGNLVGGYSYGDQYKFATLATGPERVTRASPWKATETNAIPYAMQWVDPGSGVDAEMGHVATLPLSLSDQGIDTQTSKYNNPPDFFDPRTQSHPTGPLPPDNTQAFQIINETGTLPATGTTNSKRLTWGTQWGRVGGFDEYGSFTDIKNYSQHSTDPVGQTLAGKRVSGALMAYSVFVVFGPHLGSYKTGTVGQEVTQMENVQLALLSASTGTVAASGPAGVGNASTTTISYSPKGYNPTYACWELSATNNVVNATLTPAGNASLDHPVFLIDNYTASNLPASIAVGAGLTKSGTDYFVTLDTSNKRLWITVNRVAATAVNVTVTPPYAAPTFTVDAAAVTGTSVTFSASVNPNGLAGPSTNRTNVLVSWQYGLAAGSYTTDTTAKPIGTGTSPVPVSFLLARGTMASIYHYRLAISSTVGNTYGPDQVFSFKAPSVVYSAPAATGTGAALSLTVNPNGLDTKVSIQYGLTTAYTGGTVPAGDIGSGFTPVKVDPDLTGLVPNTAYYYRVVTTNSLGTTDGPAQIFATSAVFGTTAIISTKNVAHGIAGAAFSALGNPVINDSDHTAFQATVTGGGIVAANNSGIWADSGTNGLTMIARTGASAPDYTGESAVGTFATLSDPVYANDDAVAFRGTLVVSGTATASNNVGIWATTSGTLALVARVGDHAPDATGTASASGPVFATFSQFVLPDQGGVIILATLESGVGGVISTNNTGIWAVDTNGVLKQIIRTGDALTVNGGAKIISSLAIFNAPAASAGQTRHFNNAGDLTYKATFTDGTISIVQSVFP